ITATPLISAAPRTSREKNSTRHLRLNLRLLSIYWHFLDALWIYLVVFFFINQLIWDFWP
ncbi:MAG: hypothetical protein AAFN92_05515, partial [Bacteroidota bacterium]